MMLAGPTLRTVPVTTHLPLREVAAQLTSALIESRGRAALRGLQRNFGIAEPRLAVAGLNPHAGEGGAARPRGDRDHRAGDRRACRRRLAGDRPASRRHHVPRAARAPITTRRLCMYHDQALIPIKALHFEDAVNVTLGPADRPHRARPRHRVRHRRPGPRRPAADGGGDPDGGANARSTAPTPRERPRPSRCATSSPATGSAQARRSGRISSSTGSCSRGSPRFPGRSKARRSMRSGPAPAG